MKGFTLKQAMNMMLFDIRMSMKDFYAGYVVFMPLIIVLVLRFFVPTVESATGTLAVVDQGPYAVEAAIIDRAEQFATIERYDSVEAVETKLRAAGSAEGLFWSPDAGRYVSLLERTVADNTLFSAGARVVRQHIFETEYPDAESIVRFSAAVPTELSDRTESSPVATTGGAMYLTLLTMMTGFLIGLSVVRDKELGTNRAIRVSPLSKAEYFIGKCLFPVALLLVYAFIGPAVLGLLDVNVLQLYTVAVLSVSIVLIFGVIIGALGRNETEALGLVKSLGMFMILGVLGGILLPDRWQWVVYWLPYYWSFDLMQEVLTATAQWGDVLWKSGVMVAITGLLFLGLRKRIMAGLT